MRTQQKLSNDNDKSTVVESFVNILLLSTHMINPRMKLYCWYCWTESCV